MKQRECTSRGAAIFALSLVVGKALLTVILFAQLPATHNNQHARVAAYAGNGILANLERASLQQSPLADSTSVAAPKVVRSQAAAAPAPAPAIVRQGLSHGAALLDQRSEDDARLLAILAFAESSEEKPALAHAAPLARAPPQLRHALASAYDFHPCPRVGLFLAWAIPPPLV